MNAFKKKYICVKQMFRRFVTPNGLLVLVGKHAKANDLLTFQRASPGDHWLHAKGVPGAHVVIVEDPHIDATSADILFAASLALGTKDRGAVDVTRVGNCFKPNTTLGSVAYTDSSRVKTVIV